MRHGIVTADLEEYAGPRVAVRLARAAEAAGWEAFFVWDHLGFVRGVPSGHPWVILATVADLTERLKGVRPRNHGSPDDETVEVYPTSFGRLPDVIRQLCCRVLCSGRVLRK
jgi:hypothetical protein